MNYTSIENDIVARLAPLVSAGYEVEAMPDNDGSNIPAARKGRITVQVGMVKFLEHKSISSAVVQDEEIYVEIIVRSRKLRATGGVYDLTELCRALLIGYTPTNCKVMLRGVDWGGITPSERFDGIWTYSLRLATQSVSVGSADEDISVLISQITLLDGFSIAAPTPTIDIYASAYNVENSGDQVIIAWVSTNADEVTISGLGVVAANGTATITMSVNTTFTATASNAYGDDSALINVTVGATCEDAIIELNGVQVATVASGATEDFPILNGGGNAIGTWDGTSLVVANNYTEINGVQVTDQEAEVNASIAVELDGSPSGTWNAGTQTWEVTSNPSNLQINGAQSEVIAGNSTFNLLAKLDGVAGGVYNAGLDTLNFTTTPAILQRNAIQIKTLANASTFNLKTKLDGAANNGTWDGVDTLDFTSAACSPVTFQINAVNKESLSSGSTFNLITKLDGSVNSGTYDAPTDTLSFTSAACSPVALQINGTPQESIAAGATFNLIATLDGVAGGTYTPATDTLAFTSTGGWVRPSFWPTLPTLTAASQAGYILLQVYENRLNRFTCQIYNNAAIDWGDGTTSAPTTAVRTKTYTYSTLSGTVYVDALTNENYKFVTISITASGGNISLVDFAVSAATSPLNAPSYAVDFNLSFPNATQIHFGSVFTRDNSLMQQLKLWAVGSGCYLRFGKSYNLQSLQLPVSMVLSQPTIASNIGACRVGNLDYSTTTNISSNFNGSRILSHGNLTANSATNIGYYLADAYSCESVGAVTCNAVVGGATWMFSAMTALKSIGLITMPLATDYSYMFVSSPSLNAIRFANSAACTTTTGMIQNCLSLQVLDMPNLTRGVNFTNTSMGNYGMNIFATSLGTASGAQTITITGTPYGVLVTAADATALAIRAVMTGKGYTIAN